MFLEVPRAQVRLQTHRVHVSRLVLGDLVAFTLVWVSVIAKLANWRYGVTQHLSEQNLYVCMYSNSLQEIKESSFPLDSPLRREVSVPSRSLLKRK